MPPTRPRIAVAASIFIALAPAVARAQTTTFTVDRINVAGAPSDGFAVWRPELPDKTRFFAQLGLGFSLNPLRVDNYIDDIQTAAKIKGPPLSTQLTTYVDVGVELLSRVSIQVAFPLTLYQTSNPTNSLVANLPQDSVNVSTVAPGDLRIEARGVLVRNETRSFKLGLTAAATIPTGSRYSFTGEGNAGASFGLAAEYDAKLVTLALNAAYRIRPTTVLNELLVSNEVVYGVGAYVPFCKGTLRLGAELFGGFGASSSKALVYMVPKATPRTNVGDLDTIPLEWMLNGRVYFTATQQIYAGIGMGTRLTGGYAPDFRGVALIGASFSVTDTDPRSPGSRYVFETSATHDRDQDGIPDEVDACPDEPGEMNSDPEKIGCPRYIRRIKGSTEIQVLKRIEFEFDKYTLLPVSYPILDEVVNLLKANLLIQRMAIEGHTDNQGTPEYNQRLSDGRAKSVMAYLIKRGIAPGRLTAAGYGLTRPRATNDTEDGRQKNRRVEFHIVEQAAEEPSIRH